MFPFQVSDILWLEKVAKALSVMSKAGRPNLSLAGKREAPTQQKPTRGASTSNRGSRGRGGRGRGAGPRPRQELIQTGGVFSEGLGGDFPSRKKDKDVDSAQFAYSKREKGSGGPSSSAADDRANKDGKLSINNEGKASFEGWDALWCSDEEGDQTEMKSLRPDGFLSDYRRGTVMPVVLPLEDQPQFKNVLNKSAWLSLEEDDQVDEKKLGSTEKSAEKPEKQSSEQIVAMLEASTSELLHLQLPSVVLSLCNDIRTPEDVPMETDDQDTSAGQIPSAPVLGLPQSHRIGKLQVTRKGRLLLQIGGHSIDITNKPTSGKQQGTVLLEVDPSAEDSIQNPGFSLGGQVPFENALYHLGNVRHNLVGSMTWGELNEEKNKKKEEEEEAEKTANNQMEITLDGGERVEELQKVQHDWAQLADKWAKGLFT
uniref:Uncharacterized protein n=2 Tax=Caenorhabditis japonica TaxID=281687 RepID=A0A8R1HN11_CAEJA